MASIVMYFMVVVVMVLNAIDYILLSLFNRRLMTLDKQRLVASLTDDALKELEDYDVREPVELNLDGLKHDKMLNFFNRYAIFRTIKNELEMRAAIKTALRTNLSLSQTPIIRPVFIIGLPRTGTTLLLNVLNLDPRFLAPLLWKMLSPLPAGYDPDWKKSKKYLSIARDMKIHKMLAGYSFDEVHEFRPDLPEECYFLIKRSFYNYAMFLRVVTLAGLGDWFYSRDHRFMLKMYNFYKSQLQILGYGHGMENRHFLLKSHLHNMDIPALMETFPDARLIFTYRKLSDVIPSFCSMSQHSTAYLGPLDPEFGKRALKFAAEIANRAARSLKQFKDNEKYTNQIMLLPYEKLVKDTPEALKEVYSFAGMSQTDEVRKAVETYMKENPRNKFGRHVYNLESYGITEKEVGESCHEYLEFMKEVSSEKGDICMIR